MTKNLRQQSIDMKKDIPNLKVEEIGIAIVPKDENSLDDDLWDVFLINLKRDRINSVLINSRGYGALNGEKTSTTILRHFFDSIEGEMAVQIEPIQTKLFAITNEYWVSFVYNNYMYDKKYVFVQGSISKYNMTLIPIIERKGILIK